MTTDYITAALLLGVFVIAACRLQRLHPKTTKWQVSGYFIAIAAGSWLGFISALAAPVWPWAERGVTLLPAIGLLVAMLLSYHRWQHRAPSGTLRAGDDRICSH